MSVALRFRPTATNKSKPPPERGLDFNRFAPKIDLHQTAVEKLLLRRFRFARFGFGGIALGVLAAEALDTPGGVHQLLLAGKERMAGGADFYGDIALVGRAGYKCVAAGAMHAHFGVIGMDSIFHVSS